MLKVLWLCRWWVPDRGHSDSEAAGPQCPLSPPEPSGIFRGASCCSARGEKCWDSLLKGREGGKDVRLLQNLNSDRSVASSSNPPHIQPNPPPPPYIHQITQRSRVSLFQCSACFKTHAQACPGARIRPRAMVNTSNLPSVRLLLLSAIGQIP